VNFNNANEKINQSNEITHLKNLPLLLDELR